MDKHQPVENACSSRSIKHSTLLLFAVACGLSVANVYCVQPLLDVIARDSGIAQGDAGIVVTITQIGYALGLLLIVPLGDLFNRRRLIVSQLLLSVVSLLLVGTATSKVMLLAGVFGVGLLAVVIQILVAFAATLAAPEERGKAVGTVTSGVVLGILLARTVAGALMDLAGWRSVYFVSAAFTIVIACALYRAIPQQVQAKAPSSYVLLLRSVVALFAHEPLLQVRAVLALLIFASFSTLWTSLVLPLSAPPFSLSHTEIGLFGLVGAAGALAATQAGRLADSGFSQWTTGIALVLLFLSWLPIGLVRHSLWWLILGIIVLDLAVQAVHVTNQSMLFAVKPEARSRIVAAYMFFYSIGSAVGAITSTFVYSYAGWSGVAVLGASISAAALLFWNWTRRYSVVQVR